MDNSGQNEAQSILSPTTAEELEKIEGKKYIASCFEFQCEGSALYVVIDNKKLRCKDDDIVTIDGYDGDIKCPKNEILCNQQYHCKFGCTEKYKNNTNK